MFENVLVFAGRGGNFADGLYRNLKFHNLESKESLSSHLETFSVSAHNIRKNFPSVISTIEADRLPSRSSHKKKT